MTPTRALQHSLGPFQATNNKRRHVPTLSGLKIKRDCPISSVCADSPAGRSSTSRQLLRLR